MFLIGLTGGIAAGKSTVAEHWRKLGAHEIDADQLARLAVTKGSSGLAKVVEKFGDKVLNSAGELDRGALASLVFNDSNLREELEAIVHPIVRQLAAEELAKIEAEYGPESIVVYSIPLLVETDSNLPFDVVVTVEAPEEKQIARMVKSRGMSTAEAKSRIASQATPVQRAARADHILNSNQELALLLRDAEQLFHTFEAQAAVKVRG